MNQAKALVRTLKSLQSDLREAQPGSLRADYCKQRISKCLISLVVEVEKDQDYWIVLTIESFFVGPFETEEEANSCQNKRGGTVYKLEKP
jgi:hypothetical protein